MAGSSTFGAVGGLIPPVSDAGASTGRLTPVPTLTGAGVVLRPLRSSDAASLVALLTSPDVARFIAPPPATVDGFALFIERVNHQAWYGKHACFAVTLSDHDTAVGLFQVREVEAESRTFEWGFAIGSPFWGTGVFQATASQVLAFLFERMGAHRVEARAAVRNGRGARALQKLGAVQEGVLRRAFLREGQYLDQVLYAIVEDDWRASRAARASVVPVH
jgi:RimJ/RimL family protein N-acetyltransferase